MNRTLGSFSTRHGVYPAIALLPQARDDYDGARARHAAALDALRGYLDVMSGMRPRI